MAGPSVYTDVYEAAFWYVSRSQFWENSEYQNTQACCPSLYLGVSLHLDSKQEAGKVNWELPGFQNLRVAYHFQQDPSPNPSQTV